MQKVTLNVEGMKCGGCESGVKDALLACDGVAAVQASHKDKTVAVEFDEAKLTVEQIKQAIGGKGYQVV